MILRLVSHVDHNMERAYSGAIYNLVLQRRRFYNLDFNKPFCVLHRVLTKLLISYSLCETRLTFVSFNPPGDVMNAREHRDS